MNKESAIRIVTRSLLGILATYLLYKFFLSHNGLLRQYQVQRENTHLEQQIDSLQGVLEYHKQEKERLLRDSFYIEEIARTRFGMSRPGELVYYFWEVQDSLRKLRTHPPTTLGESQ